MAKLFMCCKGCKPPKRGPTYHSTCPEYLRDAAENERLKTLDREGREADLYAIDTVLDFKDEWAKRMRGSRRAGMPND